MILILYELLRLFVALMVAVLLLCLGLIYAIAWAVTYLIRVAYQGYQDRLVEEADLARREKARHARTEPHPTVPRPTGVAEPPVRPRRPVDPDED